MAEWGPDPNWPDRPKRPPDYRSFEYYQRFPGQPGPSGSQAQQFAPPMPRPQLPGLPGFPAPSMLPVQPKGENPRELRNRHEKERRDKLNQSISELASMVPPVVAASRKIDKTSVLRLTAHFLRSHQYVFGDTIGETTELNSTSAQAVLRILEGFLLTVTYKGIIVVVSPNVQKYLGYTELELLGQNIFTMTHKDDHKAFRDSLMSKTQTLGPNGELLIPDMHEGKAVVAKALASERRTFRVRFKKHTQRSEPPQYLACQVDGSLRKSDRACRAANRCCPIVRRARARGDNPCSSGNDVVFIGVARPIVDSFKKEKQLEQFRMEYRTRHSIDGQIIQSEQRIGLVTGYMTDEVQGVNAMNLMHRDDVRWVVIALREMYDQHRLFGESCYRLMMKNGQFVYMRTRGALEVDKGTKAVTSFVCTNTVMHPTEGQHLIDQMKKKFTLLINNNEEPPQEQHVTDTNDDLPAVEDPKQLQKVILHLVTNLPSPQPEGDRDSPEKSEHIHLAIIPPRKERIVSGILRIYNLMKNISNPRFNHNVRRNFAHLEEIPESSQEEDISFEADVPPPNDQSFLPDISTFTSKSFHGRKNVDVFDELFKNLPTPPSSESYQATVEETPDLHTPASFTDYIASQPNTQSKYRFTKPDEDYKIINLEAPETSFNISGTVRSPDYPMHDETEKKKVVQAENGTNAPLIDPNSPSLESFFSEALMGSEFSQIDEDLICLENTIDPFSDLLMNPDVQEFLGDVDFDPNKQAEQRDPN